MPSIPNTLLQPKKIKRMRQLTTDQTIGTHAIGLPHVVTEEQMQKKGTFNFFNSAAAYSPGRPITPAQLIISTEFSPFVGVYIVVGSTATGKTVWSMGMSAWANLSGIPATYVSCFEPRAPLGNKEFVHSVSKNTAIGAVEAVTGSLNLGLASSAGPFSDPVNFLSDVEDTIAFGNAVKLIIYDSVTLPMKAYAAEWPDQATFTGGSQPSDRGFLDRLTKLANKTQACILVTLNSTLIPYVQSLYGAVEGLITIKDVQNFTYSDRGPISGRMSRQCTIPDAIAQAALNEFELGELRKSSQILARTGFTGLE
jgi:hypothetical protein